MAKNQDGVRVNGGFDGAVSVAAKGTTALPVDPAADLDVAFQEVGWLSSDGLTETFDRDSTDLTAWQGGTVVRTIRTKDSRTFKFQAMESNAVVLGLLRPGSTVSTVGDVTTTVVKPFAGQDERVWVFDLVDGDIRTRKVVKKGQVTEVGDITYSYEDATIYEFTVTVYPDSDGVLYREYTNDPAAELA